MVSGILLDFRNEKINQFKCFCRAKIRLWTTIVYFGIFTYLASTVKILCDLQAYFLLYLNFFKYKCIYLNSELSLQISKDYFGMCIKY